MTRDAHHQCFALAARHRQLPKLFTLSHVGELPNVMHFEGAIRVAAVLALTRCHPLKQLGMA
jgi:hypothetical protein